MRIWYVVDTFEYWLEPEWKELKAGRTRIWGCKLFNAEGVYKGYWPSYTWPTEVRRIVNEAIKAEVRRNQKQERLERMRTKSMISKTK